MKKVFLHFQLNVRELSRSLLFYNSLGMIEQSGFHPNEARANTFWPASDYAAFGTDGAAAQVVTLRFPQDSCAHLQLHDWQEKARNASGPPRLNALGFVRVVCSVADLDGELRKLRARGISILFESEATKLRWGVTRFALFRDPDGNLIEFLEIAGSGNKGVGLFEIQLNVQDFSRSVAFYESLELKADHGWRPLNGSISPDLADMSRALGCDSSENQAILMTFPEDPAGYISLQGWGARGDKSRDSRGINQLGIARIAFLVGDLDREIAVLRRLGIRLLSGPVVVENRNWSTIRYIMFRDPDGNLLEYTEIGGSRFQR